MAQPRATYLSPGVFIEEHDSGSKPIEGVGTAVAAFVGFTAHAPADDPENLAPRRVTSWGDYTRLYGGFVDGAMLPHAVYGYFSNGGGSCYIVRVPHEGDHTRVALKSATKGELETLQVLALDAGGPSEVVIRPDSAPDVPAVEAAKPEGAEAKAEGGEAKAEGTEAKARDESSAPATSFTLSVRRGGREVESFAGLTLGRTRNVETIVNQESSLIRVTAGPHVQGVAAVDRVPAAGVHRMEALPPTPDGVQSVDFQGDETVRTGVLGLAIADEVTMVAIPDLVTAATRDGQVDLGLFKAVQTTLITHCEASGNRMAILDAPPGMSPQRIFEWRKQEAMYDSKFAALYYPWLEVDNPLALPGDAKHTLSVPPCGYVAGVWARNDDTRGVWKAPANEIARGALDVATKVTTGEQELLNPAGINCIRPFGTRGIRIWGARTLASDPSWRYVNVRRLFNYIEESVLRGTQWIVFEPNDLDLWQRVKRTITAFLVGMWRRGALQGATPAEAFYVKCDAENNPPESIDTGMLVVEIGIAPVKPAEFVVFIISQWQGGAATAE